MTLGPEVRAASYLGCTVHISLHGQLGIPTGTRVTGSQLVTSFQHLCPCMHAWAHTHSSLFYVSVTLSLYSEVIFALNTLHGLKSLLVTPEKQSASIVLHIHRKGPH